MKTPSRWPLVVAVAAHLALITGILASSRGTLGLLFGLLLLLPLPGLLRGRERTHAAASMLIAFYCAGLLSNGYASADGRLLNFALGAAAALEFCAMMLFVRWRARERKLLQH